MNHDLTSLKNRPPLVKTLHTAVKGRARYKVQGLQGSESLQRYLEFYLAKENGIEGVRASASSGNVLVFFQANTSSQAIADLITKLVLDYSKQPSLSQGIAAITSNEQQIRKRTSIWRTQPFPPTQIQPRENWHLLASETLLNHLQTSVTSGLSNQSVAARRLDYGANLLSEAPPRSKLSILIEQFQSVPVALLSAAAGLSVATGGLADALVIMGVVVINAIIGYSTESHSERIIHSLKHLVKPSAWVIREQNLQLIGTEEIVLGDILVLKPGSYIAADARVIESHHLSVDESVLTGESLPVTKIAEPLTVTDIPLGDRLNMVYMGTLVTGGQGLAVVVATGQFTEMGRIQSLVGEAIVPETPMQKQLDQAGSQLVFVSSALCGVVFALGFLRGYGLLEMLKTSISLAVAAVPEGLPMVATTTLALGIQEMRRHKVLIRRLDAVEALGSVQSICLDKTGTLTLNKMTVVKLCLDSQYLTVDQGKLQEEENPIDPNASAVLLKLIEVLVLCNESELNGTTGDEYALKGSSTENALIELALDLGVDVKHLREQYPLLQIQHRSEEENVMRTLHETCQEKKLIAIKGSPTEVLALCQWQMTAAQITPLTETKRRLIEMENERMAGKALRVLGVAYGYTTDAIDAIRDQENLVWLGLVGMADPIRPGVQEVIRTFHQAGIGTVMITGDQGTTAYAIGKELNLSQGKELEILDSTHLGKLDPEVLKALSDRIHVFARISPANKLQIVQALQSAGKVVAMTGDGINDAPALKAAEVGIAMGHTGTDVAREVADVVLEDDNLQTMIVAVSRGRTIYNNIRKSVHFLLATNLSEIVVMFSANALGMGQPLNAMQLLWLNLVTDIFPGLALALEPPEPEILHQPPRDPTEPIIPIREFRRIALESATLSVTTLGAYGYALLRYGISPQASTIAFMSLTIAQLLHALSCRSQKHRLINHYQLPPNPYLTLALGGSLAIQLLSAVVPSLRVLLKLAPIHAVDVGVIALAAILPLLLNEATKSESVTDALPQQEGHEDKEAGDANPNSEQ